MTKQLKHSKNEQELIKEQNEIKKHSICIAVYDLPVGCRSIPSDSTFDTIGKGSPWIFTTKYNKNPEKAEYKLFIYNERK